MFWRWFLTDRQRIEEALQQKLGGYDVSPTSLDLPATDLAPANNDAPARLEIDRDYYLRIPQGDKA